MLAAQARLRSAKAIAHTIKYGKRHASAHVVLHFWTNPEALENQAAIGFSVSKKVGNSVVRHLITRRLRHIVAPLLASLPAGSQLVIRANPSSATACFQELQQSVEQVFAKAGFGK